VGRSLTCSTSPPLAEVFSILWKKPEVLYAPGDFPEPVSVSAYVDGMRHGSAANAEPLKAVVRDTLEDVNPPTLSQTVTPQQVTQLVDQAIASAHEGIAKRMLSVDLSAIHPDFRDFKTQSPLAEGASVADFLDRLAHGRKPTSGIPTTTVR
jgi:hypothetical protein